MIFFLGLSSLHGRLRAHLYQDVGQQEHQPVAISFLLPPVNEIVHEFEINITRALKGN